MNIDGIYNTSVESTPNYNPALGVFALSNDNQGSKGDNGNASNKSSNNTTDTLTLSPEAQEKVKELQLRDREVRAHEQAHVSAGGQYVRGGINYTYTRGPDNKQYATGGSVSLDTSPIAGDPKATQEKARILRSAALAPGNPSAQDQAVAAEASAMEAEARTEQTQENTENQSKKPSVEQNNFAANFANANATTQATTNVTEGRATQNNMAQNSASTSFAPVQSLMTDTTTHSHRAVVNNVDNAISAYKTQQKSAFISSALAPLGTGISLQV